MGSEVSFNTLLTSSNTSRCKHCWGCALRIGIMRGLHIASLHVVLASRGGGGAAGRVLKVWADLSRSSLPEDLPAVWQAWSQPESFG